MSRFIRTTFILAALVFCGQVLVAPAITIAGIAPDFTILAVVILALAEGSLAACLGGFVLGVVQGLSTPSLFGLHALVKSLLGFGCGRIRSRLVYGMPVVEGGLVVVAVLAHELLVLIGRGFMAGEDPVGAFFLRAIPGAVYTALVGMPLIRLADRLGVLGDED